MKILHNLFGNLKHLLLLCSVQKNKIDMLLQEFTKLTGFTPTEEYFNGVIHPVYMVSSMDKVAWCKKWKRNGGVQTAYNAMTEELDMTKKHLNEYIRCFRNECDQCDRLYDEIRSLRREINNYKEQVYLTK